MPTLALHIEYDGTDFSGWQIQPNGRTVQQEIADVLKSFLNIKENPTGAGRTDSGVHARQMTATVDVENQLIIPVEKIAKALNTQLPEDIRIHAAKLFDTEFNARFDAIAREYSYHLAKHPLAIERKHVVQYKYPFDEEKLLSSQEVFLGEHDFTTFSKHNPETKNHLCTIEKCNWKVLDKGRYRLEIKANRFVYGMVRSLTGAMLDVARGKISIEELKSNLKARERKLAPPLAPAHGLIFEKAYYPPEFSF
jgi:tRNA pseudouridine38-40 synthase